MKIKSIVCLVFFLLIQFVAFPCFSASKFVRIKDIDSNVGNSLLTFKRNLKLKKYLIDDYEDGNLVNVLGGNSGVWNSELDNSESYCIAKVVDVLGPEMSTKSLELSYDVETRENVQNGYWMELNGVNLQKYDTLEFFVRDSDNTQEKISFKIEIKRYLDNSDSEMLVASYIVENITHKWQRVSIPLSKFNAISNWDKIEQLIFIFMSDLSEKKKGSLYIDGIQFRNYNKIRPTAFDIRESLIQKTNENLNSTQWAEWLSKQLRGYPSEVYNKRLFSEDNNEFLREIAFDVWRYFDDIVNMKTNLPLDNISFGKKDIFSDGAKVSDYTNVTNIGMYLMAIVSAYDLDLIDLDDAISRVDAVLIRLDALETYNCFFYNYYDTTTTERTSNFVSAVDSAWLATGLYVVKNAFLENSLLVSKVDNILGEFNFNFFMINLKRNFSMVILKI